MTYEKSPLSTLESRLRALLPADLYVSSWIDPSPDTLMAVFDHLRTLHRILFDYVPRQVADARNRPGEVSFRWEEGALMFTDLAGFTPLLEANAIYGKAGASNLLKILNDYFGAMIEIISKSGGYLLEFTGDAMLALFPTSGYQNEAAQAVRAGLRMQHAMQSFGDIQTAQGTLALGMRIGIHTGKFLSAHIGTPRRMEHVLLGMAVREAKLAEGAGEIGRVCLTATAINRLENVYQTEPGKEGYALVIDEMTEQELGEYELTAFNSRRMPTALVLDRSVEGLTHSVSESITRVEPLASYLPAPILNFVVESAANRKIEPTFPELTVMFVNLIGLAENIDQIPEGEEGALVGTFSKAFALINATVESHGGILKHVTYHLSGADILIYFGMPNAHADDPARAAHTAFTIRDIVQNLDPPIIDGKPLPLSTKIGLDSGAAFAAEVGEQRGRREFNILGDTVNTAARLMSIAEPDQVLMTEAVYHHIWRHFDIEPLKRYQLKGKSRAIPVFALEAPFDD
jgi:class 3 adenylate cyclase